MLPINKEVGGSPRGEGAAGTGDKVRTFTGLSLCSMSRNCQCYTFILNLRRRAVIE